MLSVFFVKDDAPPAGDGTSWTTSFDDLQAALDAALVRNADDFPENDIDQIWIAEGTYLPSKQLEADDPRSAAFTLVDGVTLFGGFAGMESALADRVLGGHETVLSGDLGVVDDSSENAYTVVYCAQAVEAVLDGVTVTGGNADGEYDSNHPERQDGGGIFCLGELAFARSSVSENSAVDEGGGIHVENGALTVSHSTLSENTVSDSGGGVYCVGSLAVTHSTIAENSAPSGVGHLARATRFGSGTRRIPRETQMHRSVCDGRELRTLDRMAMAFRDAAFHK